MLEAVTDRMPFALPETDFASGSSRCAAFVADETNWRVPLPMAQTVTGSRIRATRWRTLDRHARECRADAPSDCHVVKVVLRSTNMRLAVGARAVQDGVATPGMFHVTEPDARATALFRGSFDALHIYIPTPLMNECAGSLSNPAARALGSMTTLAKDPIIDSLARALLDADLAQGGLSLLYVDCIGVALVARLLHAANSGSPDRPKVAELPRWRLKRAIDFIEAGLEQALSLADIANAVGLSRMHFAAQFKAATGLRPHEYLLKRRIERAQEMLVRTEQSIVDIAMSVGFQTQSHFTTMFKRFAGQTPQAWRRCHATG